MHKTRIDFQEAAFNLKPKKWFIRKCSICGYDCGYVFIPNHEHVGYDSGCYCTNSATVHPCSWDDLAEHYNDITDPEEIAEMNKFWGFAD